jgi:multidrug efflux pump subunit AcrB
MSFFRLGIDLTPNIDIPAVIVNVTQPGAGPAELETQVTKKVEDAVAGLGNIDQLTSTVRDGVSTTTIAFVLGTDTDRATNDVRNAVAEIRQDLPADVNDPIVRRLEFAGGAVMMYAVKSDKRSVEELSEIVDRDISRAILKVTGVAEVDRVGGVDREIRIELNPDRLESLGITATEVNDQIKALNIDLPGGRSELGGTEKNIRTLGSAPTVETLRNYPIQLPSGASVPLTSIANVIDGPAQTRQIARFEEGNGEGNRQEARGKREEEGEGQEATNNQSVKSVTKSVANEIGQPIVGFEVLRSTGSTLVTVEEGVRKEVEKLRSTLPEDIKIELIFTRADEIRESYQASIDALVIGSLLTVIVVFAFLRDWRPTLITAIALPLSIVPTFLVMEMCNYTLNGMSLLALSLAMGNLVDDAICMIENIDQHVSRGKNPFRAALDGAAEIGLAVIATTATIVSVFLPVAFMGGIPGQFFQPFGVTVATATMFSTLVACTMTPMLAARLLQKKAKGKRQEATGKKKARGKREGNTEKGLYWTVLTWALRHKIFTLLFALVLFFASLQLVPLIPKGLFAGGDTGISTVLIDLPPGSTIEDSDRTTQKAMAAMQQNPAVENMTAVIGDGGTDGSLNSTTLYVKLKPKAERSVSQQQFEAQMREQFTEIPGARISFRSTGGGGNSKDLSIVLKSENAPALKQAADALERQMRQIPGLVEVTSSASLVKPEILITPNVERAGDLGVSVRAIARTASLATLGDNEANLAKFDLADRQIPIRVQLAEEFRNDLKTIKNLRVPSANGSLVPLSAVANITIGSGPSQIDRFDRERQVTVEANLQGISLGDAVEKVQALPAMNPLPAGVGQQSEGDAEIMIDVFTRFLSALALAVMGIYGVLVLLYNNFLYPMVILMALPLSVGGALLALMITQKELGLFALIGIVLLMGLVTKNAILLVDCSLANEKQGMSQFQAVREAGISRLRPILMTTLSTMAGMLPIALEIGAGAETRSPMAIAVIGGFSTSTLLTLIVIPVWFTYIDNFQHWLSRLFGGGKKREATVVSANGNQKPGFSKKPGF